MTILYSTLAGIYHEMYQSIFDYDKEYAFYDSILKKNQCSRILEIGCGSGMLGRRFLQGAYDYTGLDLYDEMLEIARAETGADVFIRGDMRNLSFESPFDAIMITGRSLAYITDNKGIADTFSGIHQSLREHGIFIFGIFDAESIFDHFEDFEQEFQVNARKITRSSRMVRNLQTGFTWDWHARYTIEESGKVSVFDDITTLRAFTKDEILLFLKLFDFNVLKIIEEDRAITIIANK